MIYIYTLYIFKIVVALLLYICSTHTVLAMSSSPSAATTASGDKAQKEALKALHGEFPKLAMPLVTTRDLLKKNRALIREIRASQAVAASRAESDPDADAAEAALLVKLQHNLAKVLTKYDRLAALAKQ